MTARLARQPAPPDITISSIVKQELTQQTYEGTARCIVNCLVYLRDEAAKIGLQRAAQLIGDAEISISFAINHEDGEQHERLYPTDYKTIRD